MAKGSALKGALAAAPRGGRINSLPVGTPRPMPLGKPNSAGMVAGIAQGAGAGLQRMSPGVYRNPQGQLVNSKGGALPGQRQQQRPQMPNRFNDISTILGGGAQFQNPQQMPPYKPYTPNLPSDGGIPMYMGGSPNFNETTGQYDQRRAITAQAEQEAEQQFAAGFGAGLPPTTDTGFAQYLKQQTSGMQQMPQGQQAPMPVNPNYNQQLNQQQQQAFNQQQAMGNSLTRMMPNGRMVY